jgi:hypothetical protein
LEQGDDVWIIHEAVNFLTTDSLYP